VGFGAKGKMIKSIVLIMPNGNEHEVLQGDYAFEDDTVLLKAEMAAGQRWIIVNAHGGSGK
jgi:pyridoxal/pyridoxine/pyridoxamine kinase